jgi:DNA polymerase III delta subunit
MTYLFIGRDLQKKDAKLAELKTKLFKDASALPFDYEVLSAHKLDSDDFMKSLLALPHLAAQRMVVIRQCERLNEHNRDIIFEIISQDAKTLVVVLDFDELDIKSAFFSKLRPHVQLVNFGGDNKVINVFDVTRAISSRDTAGAVRILNELIGNNTHPLQIMGGLVWYWSKERDHLSAGRFQKGLEILEEGDLNIKRSRLRPEYAVEKVVVELTLLQG